MMSEEPTVEEYVRDVKLVIEAEDFLRSLGWTVPETRSMNDETVIRTAISWGWS